MLEEKLLLWKLRHGDKDALCVIYERYKDYLLRIASSLLTEKSLAEDAVHDVFAGFVSRYSSFRLIGSLRGYFATCVANKARNINRTKARQRTVSLDEAELAVSKTKRPDEWIVYDEQFERIRDAMCGLSYEQREAVVLHIQGAMKFREIALLQEVSVKTVISRYRYGLDKLRSILNSEEIK